MVGRVVGVILFTFYYYIFPPTLSKIYLFVFHIFCSKIITFIYPPTLMTRFLRLHRSTGNYRELPPPTRLSPLSEPILALRVVPLGVVLLVDASRMLAFF